MLTTLITIVLVLIIVGFCLWLIDRFVPLDGAIKAVIYFIIVIGLVLFILDKTGIYHIR